MIDGVDETGLAWGPQAGEKCPLCGATLGEKNMAVTYPVPEECLNGEEPVAIGCERCAKSFRVFAGATA
jgi:hypothetical protein